ncbi:MAG: AtpZ/AtpI family protein [Acidimicrobiales bacterium]|jgi:F0F1-type ATP synthase assembly protein I
MEDPIPASDPGPDPPTPGRGSDPVRGAVEFLTLGLTVAVALLVCGALGYLVDRWLGTSPWFTLVGVVLGIAAAVLLTVSRVRRLL